MHTYPYPRAALTVDAIVYVKNADNYSILLIQRKNEPYRNKWALPGGFIDMHETLEQACIRELEEETGIKIKQVKQFRAYDAVNRDPRHRTISVVFSAELSKTADVNAGDDAAQAKWFDRNKLPDLAFDHLTILNDFFG